LNTGQKVAEPVPACAPFAALCVSPTVLPGLLEMKTGAEAAPVLDHKKGEGPAGGRRCLRPPTVSSPPLTDPWSVRHRCVTGRARVVRSGRWDQAPVTVYSERLVMVIEPVPPELAQSKPNPEGGVAAAPDLVFRLRGSRRSGRPFFLKGGKMPRPHPP
jgi:hypothetical protein